MEVLQHPGWPEEAGQGEDQVIGMKDAHEGTARLELTLRRKQYANGRIETVGAVLLQITPEMCFNAAVPGFGHRMLVCGAGRKIVGEDLADRWNMHTDSLPDPTDN